mmetsp:Transcript_38159/g.122456  ORF Transcript_38159/g.122456 Transcript_38159/m.122456 type:complete len:509 (+) Transcript_38159:41-1567(+)
MSPTRETRFLRIATAHNATAKLNDSRRQAACPTRLARPSLAFSNTGPQTVVVGTSEAERKIGARAIGPRTSSPLLRRPDGGAALLAGERPHQLGRLEHRLELRQPARRGAGRRRPLERVERRLQRPRRREARAVPEEGARDGLRARVVHGREQAGHVEACRLQRRRRHRGGPRPLRGRKAERGAEEQEEHVQHLVARRRDVPRAQGRQAARLGTGVVRGAVAEPAGALCEQRHDREQRLPPRIFVECGAARVEAGAQLRRRAALARRRHLLLTRHANDEERQHVGAVGEQLVGAERHAERAQPPIGVDAGGGAQQAAQGVGEGVRLLVGRLQQLHVLSRVDDHVLDGPLPVAMRHEHAQAIVAAGAVKHLAQQPVEGGQEGAVVLEEPLVRPQADERVEQPVERRAECLRRRRDQGGARHARKGSARRRVPKGEHLALGLVALEAVPVLQRVQVLQLLDAQRGRDGAAPRAPRAQPKVRRQPRRRHVVRVLGRLRAGRRRRGQLAQLA